MGSTSRKGKAQINPNAPRALGICDRCGDLHNLEALQYQYEWRGTVLMNTQLRVCDWCRDIPNEQLRAIILPPDPLPVYDPRVEPYAIDEKSEYIITASFVGRAGVDVVVTSAPQPFMASFSVTAAMSATLKVQQQITALISGSANMVVAFAGQQTIIAGIGVSANVTALLQSGLKIQGATISTTAAMTGTLMVGQTIVATVNPAASMAATLQQGIVVGAVSIGTAANMAAALTQFTPAKGRYVNRYSFTWSGTTGSFTIPSGDLTLAGSGKQILVCLPAEAPLVTGCTIGGTNGYLIASDPAKFMFMFGHTYSGSGNVAVVVTDGTSTEVSAADVYEFTDCQPLYSGYCVSGSGLTAVGNAQVFSPIGGVTAGSVMNTTDTVTFTWTGPLTERTDADAGDMRLSSADSLTAAASEVRSTAVATGTGGTGRMGGAITAVPVSHTGVRGGMIARTSIAVTGATVTFAASMVETNHTNAGSFKLLFVFACEVDTITPNSVTYNGSAMTLVGSVVNTGASPDIKIYAYAIDVTQVAPNGAVVVTWSATMGTGATFDYSLTRLYGVNSVGTAGTSQGNGTTASTTVNVSAGGLILGFQIRSTAADNTNTWTGLDEISDQDVSGFGMTVASRWQCAAETARAISCLNSASGQYAMLAIPFNP